ncbi:MAG: hypothetical protein ACLQO1_19625 [Steroidobacteraceae bacterium]
MVYSRTLKIPDHASCSLQNTTLPAEIVQISAGKSTSLAAIIPGSFFSANCAAGLFRSTSRIPLYRVDDDILDRSFRSLLRRAFLVTPREVRMMCCCLMLSCLVVFCGFLVVPCRVFMMFCCFAMMLGCFLRHKFLSSRDRYLILLPEKQTSAKRDPHYIRTCLLFPRQYFPL